MKQFIYCLTLVYENEKRKNWLTLAYIMFKTQQKLFEWKPDNITWDYKYREKCGTAQKVLQKLKHLGLLTILQRQYVSWEVLCSLLALLSGTGLNFDEKETLWDAFWAVLVPVEEISGVLGVKLNYLDEYPTLSEQTYAIGIQGLVQKGDNAFLKRALALHLL